MRFAHVIKKNKNSETPYRVGSCILHILRDERGEYSFDYGKLHLLAKSSTGNGWTASSFTFTGYGEFWELIEALCIQKKRQYCVVSDAAKTLTLLNAFTYPRKHGWILTQVVLGKKTTLIRFRKDKKTLQFLGASNIWPVPSLTIVTGANVVCKSGKNSAHDVTACVNRIAWTAKQLATMMAEWCDFLKTNDLGGFATTLSGQAMRTYRHRYMHCEIFCDANEHALKLARAAFKGARVECFHVGKITGQFAMLDVNSMYAYIMHDLRVPVRLRGISRHATIAMAYALCETAVMVARCIINTPWPVYGMRDKDHLCFPTGRFTTTLCGDEFVHAIRRRVVEHISELAVYDSVIAFRPFVDAMYARRINAFKSGDYAESDKYKLLLSGFYGKWGQYGGQWENVDHVDSDAIQTWLEVNYDTKEVRHFRQFGGLVQCRSRDTESMESHPAIAACVTAGARMYLWQLMTEAGLDHVVYVDTDALIVDRVGVERLSKYLDAVRLGALKIKWTTDRLTIHTTKDYEYGDHRVTAGLSSLRHDVDANHTVEFQNHALAWILRRQRDSRLLDKEVKKTWKRTYSKSEIEEDGKVKMQRRTE